MLNCLWFFFACLIRQHIFSIKHKWSTTVMYFPKSLHRIFQLYLPFSFRLPFKKAYVIGAGCYLMTTGNVFTSEWLVIAMSKTRQNLSTSVSFQLDFSFPYSSAVIHFLFLVPAACPHPCSRHNVSQHHCFKRVSHLSWLQVKQSRLTMSLSTR